MPMAPQSIPKIRHLALTVVVALRQRSVRQETTMARAKTSPSDLYQREIQPVEPVSLRRSDFEEQQEKSGKGDEEEDGILEYDSPSDNDDIKSLEREARGF